MNIKSKPMNIFLWVLQIAFAFYFITGALYMSKNYEFLANPGVLDALPSFFWQVLAGLEILSAVGLVLPGIIRKYPQLTSISAISMAALSLLGAVLYSSFVGIGLLWAVFPALVLAFIAYMRWPAKS